MKTEAGGRQNSSLLDQPTDFTWGKDEWESLEIPMVIYLYISSFYKHLTTAPRQKICYSLDTSICALHHGKINRCFERFLFSCRTRESKHPAEMSLCKIPNSFQLQGRSSAANTWPLTYTTREANNPPLEIIKALHYYNDVKIPTVFPQWQQFLVPATLALAIL